MEIRNRLLETGRNAIFVVKWQRTLLNCALVFCGRYNLQAMKFDVEESSKQSVERVT